MVSAPNGASGAVAASEDKKARISMHGYDYSNKFGTTLRFAECTPFLAIDAVPHDNLSIRNAHSLRTLSLKSPLMQDLKLNKDYFAIPKRALLPRNWDKIYNNPVFGDDVKANLHNTLIYLGTTTNNALESNIYGRGILYVFENLLSDLAFANNGLAVTSFTDAQINQFLRVLALFDSIFSKDSLAAALEIPIADRYGDNLAYEIQDVLDALWACYHQMLTYINGNYPAAQTVDFRDDLGNPIFRRHYDFSGVAGRMEFYFDFLENPNITFGLSNIQALATYTAGIVGVASSLLTSLDPNGASRFPVVFEAGTNGKTWLNIDVLIAYQLAMFEYQTNDKIDQVFSADMLRALYETVVSSNQASGSQQAASSLVFEYNGEWYPYDGFSAMALSQLASFAGYTSTTARNYSLFLNLFTRKRSLRYVDYFVGAKRSPLAVGNTNVMVSSNQVDVVDITRNIQLQRFLNQVNRVGQKAKHYLKGIFGTELRTRTDVPVKLAHTDEVIFGVETQNTGSSQVSDAQSITTNLSSRSSDFAFEMSFEEPTIVMGICSFEITRFYDRSLSPFASKVDRFDMFNPMMQYVGDQELPLKELIASAPDGVSFGFTTRNMEYKTRVDYCSGAFRDELRSWLFHDKPHLYTPTRPLTIDSDYIRAHQSELDEYYLAMTGTDPLHRYHFIVVFNNNVKATRNMVPAPEIIG